MSYIRCLSNPEGLYIWGDISGDAVISGGPDEGPGSPPQPWRSMPNALWEKLLETWVDSYYDENVAVTMLIDGVRHEATLAERLWPERSMEEDVRAFLEDDKRKRGRSMIRITYQNSEGKEWELDGIWPVTMHYIVDNAFNPYLGAGWLKRKLLEFLGVKP